jgi:hypothetical protein
MSKSNMITEEIKQLTTAPRELRKFGVLVGAVFVLLGGWCIFRHKSAWPWLISPGVLLLVLGLLAPRSLKRPYVVWMTLAYALGLLVSTTILTVFFYLVVTPVALVARLCGKDFLSLKIDRQARSYWLLRDRSHVRQPPEYEQQF